MDVIIITLVSSIGLATMSRVGMVSGINFYNYYIRKKRKKDLKKLLKKNITECDFIGFQNTIYKIKAYDNAYNKYLYVKMKKKYFFNDYATTDIIHFEKRFNLNDKIFNKDNLRKIIKEEIELSLSLEHNNLYDITDE